MRRKTPEFYLYCGPQVRGPLLCINVWFCQALPTLTHLFSKVDNEGVSSNEFNAIFYQVRQQKNSVENVYKWLDATVNGLGYTSTLAMAPNGQRIPGFYHHMTKEQYTKFRGCLEVVTRQWHFDCLSNNLSAGFMVEPTGGTCGTGSLLTSAINIGPFIY